MKNQGLATGRKLAEKRKCDQESPENLRKIFFAISFYLKLHQNCQETRIEREKDDKRIEERPQRVPQEHTDKPTGQAGRRKHPKSEPPPR